MQYEIKAFDKQSGSALVRFWTDDFPAGLIYNVDIPIDGGAYITGAALDNHIQSFAPYGQIARLVATAALDSTAIEAMVAPEVPPVKTPERIRAEQIAEIDRIKNDKLRGGFVHGGATYPCDGIFQQQITAFVVAWDAGVLPIDATVSIRTYDDRIVLLGYADVKALAAALLTYVQSIYAESWAAKDALA